MGKMDLFKKKSGDEESISDYRTGSDDDFDGKKIKRMHILLYVEVGIILFLVFILILRLTGVLKLGPKGIDNKEMIASDTIDGQLISDSEEILVSDTEAIVTYDSEVEETNEEVNEKLDKAINNLNSSMAILMAGNYEVDDKTFNFGTDGSYSGYLNDENTEVSGTYIIENADSGFLITITCEAGDVQYKVAFDSAGIILYDLEGNELYTLN